MRVGYARVSAKDMNLAAQLARLAGCDKVYQEKRSGKRSDRPALREAMDFVREGDALVVTRLDRLARSVAHLCVIGETLERKRVDLVVLDQAIDTATPVGRLLFHVIAAIAEFELTIRAERGRDGIETALAAGVRFGRTPAFTAEQVGELRALRQGGMGVADLCRHFGSKRSTIYKYLGTRPQVEAG